MRLLVLLLAAVALPAAAQVVPDELPDPTEPFADRANRELIERHRPFLSGLFASSTLAVGLEVGAPELIGAVGAEGGYRFESGHALALSTSVRGPLERNPLTGDRGEGLKATVGGEMILSLGRGAARRSILRGAEVGVGLGVDLFEDASGTGSTAAIPSVSLSPRIAIPVTPTLAVPVGLRVTQEVGADARPAFVGLSLGVRRIWADAARMVLE